MARKYVVLRKMFRDNETGARVEKKILDLGTQSRTKELT